MPETERLGKIPIFIITLYGKILVEAICARHRSISLMGNEAGTYSWSCIAMGRPERVPVTHSKQSRTLGKNDYNWHTGDAREVRTRKLASIVHSQPSGGVESCDDARLHPVPFASQCLCESSSYLLAKVPEGIRQIVQLFVVRIGLVYKSSAQQ